MIARRDTSASHRGDQAVSSSEAAAASIRRACATSACHTANASPASARAASYATWKSPSGDHTSPISSPAKVRRNQARSTSAMCRTSPSSDSAEGGEDFVRSCSVVSPAHLASSVARWKSRWPRSDSRSLPFTGGETRSASPSTGTTIPLIRAPVLLAPTGVSRRAERSCQAGGVPSPVFLAQPRRVAGLPPLASYPPTASAR